MKLAVFFVSLLILTGAQVSANIVIAVTPQIQNVSIGSIAQVQVSISGLGLNVPPSLGAYDLNLAFDPTILSITGLTFGDPLQGDQLDPSGIGTISDSSNAPAGQLEFFEISLDQAAVLDSLQSDSFVLTTLQFAAIGGGTSFLTPTLNSIGDSAGAALNASLQPGSIDVVTTPEPSSFAVLSLAMAGLVWRVHRRHRLVH